LPKNQTGFLTQKPLTIFHWSKFMIALLLLAFGGPRSLEEVEFLLTRLFQGRKPSPEVLEKVKERYRFIGGSSPLLPITQGQAKGLEERLNAKGHRFKSYVGMRYSHPLIEETLRDFNEYPGGHRPPWHLSNS
jgi:ferrochelatase